MRSSIRILNPGYNVNAIKLFNATTVAPNGPRRRLISNTIQLLEQYNLWNRLDVFWATASATTQLSGLNWKDPNSFALTAVNSPTFVADRGYTGDGSTSYLTTGFNISSSGLLSQNNAHAGIWMRTTPDAAINRLSLGAINTNGIQVGSNNVGSAILSRAFAAASDVQTGVPLLGHVVASRSGATAGTVWKNGVLLASPVTASAAPPSTTVYLLARNNNGTADSFSNGQIAAAHIGQNLTAADMQALYFILNRYMMAVGAV